MVYDSKSKTLSEAMEDSENVSSNPRVCAGTRTMSDIVSARLSRRQMMGGAMAAAFLAGCRPTGDRAADADVTPGAAADTADSLERFAFDEIAHGVDETHHVAAGYDADILIRWGDPLFPDMAPFDPLSQSAADQERRFGYNNDYIGYLPLEPGAGDEARGLLCVNHEYTIANLMFPGLGDGDYRDRITAEQVAVEMAAHGGSVVEVYRRDGKWSYRQDSPYNRRITMTSTEMEIAGPAAGSDRLKTSADPSGRRVIGMMNNCAGGMTPWGTYLSGEENFNGNFMGDLPDGHPEAENYERLGVPGGWYAWGRFEKRFDIGQEPNEPNRFGWVVETDPLDPASMPKKRTALGRFKHEGAETVLSPDGRVVVYMGDDQRFDYVYKFVTAGSYDPDDRAANMDLLDEGTLYVARFDENGGLEWLPLVHGEGPLTAPNGFASQGDVVIEVRRAADLLGATPMDRPEDVQPDARAGKVYVNLTNNSRREEPDAANPRAENMFGHVIEITEPDGDFAATRSTWDILVRCGDPLDSTADARWNAATSENGWFASPDNAAIDGRGGLWIATDQGGNWPLSGTADGIFSLETEGPGRGTGKMFFRVPVGAEMCGPCFTPDSETLFVAVQHPASDGTTDYEPFGRESTFEDPATRWPDFGDVMPPRPSVVVITKKGGGPIGS